MLTARAGLAALAGVLLASCGGGGGGTPSPSPTHNATPTPAPAQSATPTPSGGQLSCQPLSGSSSERARITDVRIGTTAANDTLVVQFESAVTQYQLVQNLNGVTFTGGGGKGGTFTLAGTYGFQLNVNNLNWTEPPGNQYAHGTDLTQAAPTVVEVRQIGDFEGVVNIAIGLGRPVCPSVSTLTGPPRLVIQFSNG